MSWADDRPSRAGRLDRKDEYWGSDVSCGRARVDGQSKSPLESMQARKGLHDLTPWYPALTESVGVELIV